IKPMLLTCRPMPQDRLRLARIMIRIVIEEHNLTSQFPGQTACRPDLGHQKAPWKKSTGLLTECDDRRLAHDLCDRASDRGPGFSVPSHQHLPDQRKHDTHRAADEVVPQIADLEVE